MIHLVYIGKSHFKKEKWGKRARFDLSLQLFRSEEGDLNTPKPNFFLNKQGEFMINAVLSIFRSLSVRASEQLLASSSLPNSNHYVIIRTSVGIPSLGCLFCPMFSFFPP